MEKEFRFNIRVYGIIKNQNDEILVTDEYQLDTKMTKFPGGGIKYGEGIIDCLKREVREECNGQEIKNISHFYTTDFFQEALFYKNHQLISIYYQAEFSEPLLFRISEKTFDFEEMKNGSQSFRWVKRKMLNPDEFSFPIDKFVVQLLKEKGF